MDKTDIHGDVSQIIKADTATIESGEHFNMSNGSGVNCANNAGTIINGQVNNYSVNIAVKPTQQETESSNLNAKHRELVAKVFIGGLFFIAMNISLKFLADNPLGWFGELLTAGTMVGVIAASAIIFKSK